MKNKRLDFLVEEAGCLIWVGARSLGGLTTEEFARVWYGTGRETVKDLILRGAFMPMTLYQDDGYLVRFVLGDLTAQEESDWTARARWKLKVPCGEVIVSGVLTPDFDYEFKEIVPAEDGGSYFLGGYVGVPPGEYLCEVMAYPPGDLSTGWGQISNPQLFEPVAGIEPEKPMDYFRRTRPGEEPPEWLNDAELAHYYDKDTDGFYVNFIVRLAPLSEDFPLSDLEADFFVQWTFRKPEVCPTGLKSDFA